MAKWFNDKIIQKFLSHKAQKLRIKSWKFFTHWLKKPTDEKLYLWFFSISGGRLQGLGFQLVWKSSVGDLPNQTQNKILKIRAPTETEIPKKITCTPCGLKNHSENLLPVCLFDSFGKRFLFAFQFCGISISASNYFLIKDAAYNHTFRATSCALLFLSSNSVWSGTTIRAGRRRAAPLRRSHRAP